MTLSKYTLKIYIAAVVLAADGAANWLYDYFKNDEQTRKRLNFVESLKLYFC